MYRIRPKNKISHDIEKDLENKNYKEVIERILKSEIIESGTCIVIDSDESICKLTILNTKIDYFGDGVEKIKIKLKLKFPNLWERLNNIP